MAEVDLRYLILDLRLSLYDITEPYTYSDEVLSASLLSAIKMLGRKWKNRYIPTTEYYVQRNTALTYSLSEPPVIEPGDEAVIILQASIIIKTARVYDSTWDIASWKDDEISYSNIQGAKSRDQSLRNDLDELNALLKERLHPGKYSPLPGYHKNQDEYGV